jgi:hypothetical protein
LTEESFNPLRSSISFLKLDTSNYFEAINIYFNHCTLGASGRQLKLTDNADKVIMVWEFGDKDVNPLMRIPISEILRNSSISSNSSYMLYYIDKEYPVWRLLAPVFVGQKDIRKADTKVSSIRFDETVFLYAIGCFTVIFLIYRFARLRSLNRLQRIRNSEG